MAYSLKDIAKDLIAGKLRLSEDELASERIKVCEQCPHFKKMARQCELCGCFLDLKTKVLHASCPVEKW